MTARVKLLLDTNIIIHREASRVVRKDIGILFQWIDRLGYQKCIHPLSLYEIRKYRDVEVVAAIEAKTKNYIELKTQAPETPQIQALRAQYDTTENDQIDTSLLKELFQGRVDLFISEDRKVHEKAQLLGIADRVFTIDAFLEKAVAENPELTDYRVLSVKKELFGNISLTDHFFDSFREDYQGFDHWFNRKADETAYICRADDGSLLAFLYVKIEHPGEDYSDIDPVFKPKRRLKIGTFKVIANGYKLGERFLKIVFDNALRFSAEEIYVTIFYKTPEHERLITLLEDWGFYRFGLKHSQSGEELVYVRDLSRKANLQYPSVTYPFISRMARKFIVPIYPAYHTELFPDSILRTESPLDFVENRPNRNAISKVYVSHSRERGLVSGDILVFYRTKHEGPAYYTSVATTLGVVQDIVDRIPNLEKFIALCRKRSVFNDAELAEQWNKYGNYKPFIVNFLYVHTFPHRLNLQKLTESGIIREAPRGFERLSDDSFMRLLEKSNADQSLVVD